MKLNLQESIDYDIGRVVNLLYVIGFESEDNHRYLEYNDNDLSISIGVYIEPTLLSYMKGGKGVPVEEVTEVWIGLCLTDESEKNAQKLKQMITTMLPIKPFKDEDAYLGVYSNNDGEYTLYLNPDYPNGFWYNHTL